MHGDLRGIITVAKQLHGLGQTVLAYVLIGGDASIIEGAAKANNYSVWDDDWNE